MLQRFNRNDTSMSFTALFLDFRRGWIRHQDNLAWQKSNIFLQLCQVPLKPVQQSQSKIMSYKSQCCFCFAQGLKHWSIPWFSRILCNSLAFYLHSHELCTWKVVAPTTKSYHVNHHVNACKRIYPESGKMDKEKEESHTFLCVSLRIQCPAQRAGPGTWHLCLPTSTSASLPLPASPHPPACIVIFLHRLKPSGSLKYICI